LHRGFFTGKRGEKKHQNLVKNSQEIDSQQEAVKIPSE